MVFNNLPPQAYTRDTLALAYEWLSTQPASVREIANNADTLVALYLQSRRRVGGAPISKDNLQPARQVGTANHSQVENAIKSQATYESEGFKNDLKALAENMRQFENPKPTPPAATPPARIGQEQLEERIVEEVLRKTALERTFKEASAPMPPLAPPPATSTTITTSSAPQTPATAVFATSSQPPVQRPHTNPTIDTRLLDPRSLEILRETCQRLNLGSEQEALRMLLVLGSERLHSLLSQK